MDNLTKAKIKEIADMARSRIKNSYLFGEPVNMDDPDMVVAAVYTMMAHEELRKGAEELDRVLSIFGRR